MHASSPLLGALLGLAVTPGLARAEPPPAPVELAPVPVDELRSHAPAPQGDVGLVLGVCGVGKDALWQATEFCGAAIGELHWLRRRQGSLGLGPYVEVGTAGFADLRASLGASLHVPLGPLALGARAGALLVTFAEGAAPGAELELEFGLRGLNPTGHYALTHGLVLGADFSAGDGSRAGSVLSIALRLDAFWLAAPFGAL